MQNNKILLELKNTPEELKECYIGMLNDLISELEAQRNKISITENENYIEAMQEDTKIMDKILRYTTYKYILKGMKINNEAK